MTDAEMAELEMRLAALGNEPPKPMTCPSGEDFGDWLCRIYCD